ncbi:MAG: ABC transporter permease [Proteobacteria bacterium]|nr:ABC transporter permease [Pseudomonadota bacterium]
MRFEDFVGLRYLMAKRDRNMLSVITLISVGGVAVGVMALIVVLSVMGGFEADFREKIIGSKAHVVIRAKEGYLEDYGAIMARIRDLPRIEGMSAYVEAEVMLNSPTNLQTAVLRGVDYREITTTTRIGEYMEEGELSYLENADVLPSISTAGTVLRRGALTIHSDEGDPALTPERVASLERAGAKAALAFAGSKHGGWLADGALSGLDEAAAAEMPVQEEAAEPQAMAERKAVPGEAVVTEEEQWLLEAIGEDSWVEEGRAAGRVPGLVGEFDRYPNADLVAQSSQRRIMKALPGLSEDDVGVRRVGGILLGRELKVNMGLFLGAEVHVMSPTGDVGPAGGLPKSRPFKLVGSYYSGMFDFDAKMGYVSLREAQSLLGIGDRVTGIDVRTRRLEDSTMVRDAIRAALADDPNIEVEDWKTLNASLFGAIMLEKMAMFVILTSIILVASFSILCLLIMMVIEKAREIAIFKAMGTSTSSIVRIFVVQGAAIGGLGTVIGAVLGLGMCWIIASLGIKLPGGVYYITQIPVTVIWGEVGLICLAAFGISLLATVLPSIMAVRLDPVEGLRND